MLRCAAAPRAAPAAPRSCAQRAARVSARAPARRSYATGGKPLKVAVLGAAGGIGQPLSLLLKQNPRGYNQLSLYDIVNTPGVAADLSHIPTACKVTGHVGEAELAAALQGVHVAVVPAGVPRKPGMTRDDLFNTNATIVYKLATAIAKHAPEAHILVISNPVNSTVPIVVETLKKHGVTNTKRVFGVTTLDVLRANTFVAEAKGLDPAKTDVTVIGGHAGTTILPLFSQLKDIKLSAEEIEKLTHRVQFGGDEVVKAKAGTGSATLSMAVAAFRFTHSLIRAAHGEKVTECAYVQSTVADGLSYFASRVELGADGAVKIHPTGTLSSFEQAAYKAMLPELQGHIKKGEEFVRNQK